ALDVELETEALAQAGFNCRVRHVETREEFLEALDTREFHLVLADYKLPAFDGLSALKLFLQRRLDIPFILVSGMMGEEVAIDSLKSGATDYVLKNRLSRLGPAAKRALAEKEELQKRKQAEEALKDSEVRFRSIFEDSPIGIEIYDAQGRLLNVNRAYLNIFGIAAPTGITGFSLFDKPDLPPEAKIKLDKGEYVKYECALHLEEVVTPHPFNTSKSGTVNLAVAVTPLKAEKNLTVTGYLVQVRDITESKQYEEDLRTSTKQLQALTSHLQSAREEERIRVARELHDELSPVLTVLKMGVVKISDGLGELKLHNQVDDLLRKTDSMEHIIDNSVQLVRNLITQLRPGILDDLGLIPAIEWLTEEFQENSGIQYRFTSATDHVVLGEKESTAVFRIVQEVLTNSLRHASASKVDIHLEPHHMGKEPHHMGKEPHHMGKEPHHIVKGGLRLKRPGVGGFVLKIVDNGCGIKETEINGKQSFGIMGMRERVNIYGWNLSISGAPGKGTEVVLEVPGGDRV
ncbi:MAG: PAS domain S-box protein, partial [bacterium]|nr:PAS domain S-box protein [bacterium]